MAKSRNVEYNLKIVADGGNAKTTAEAVKQFKEVETASMAAAKAAKEAMTATARSYARGGGGGGASGGGGPSDPDFRKHVQSLGKQYAENERLAKQSAAASSRAWKEAGSAVTAATHATISYGRAIVLATAADEESAQRMLQKIAKFEAFASVLTGTIQLVKAGTSAWKAYHAAQAAGSLAKAAGGAMSGAGGRIASGVAGGIAAGGAVAGAKAFGSAAIGAATNPLTGVALITAATISAGYSVGMALKAGKTAKQGLLDTGNLIWDGTREFLGITDMAGDAAKQWKQRRSNVASAYDESMREAGTRTSEELTARERRREMIGIRENSGVKDLAFDREALRAGKDGGVKEDHSQALAAAKERLKWAAQDNSRDRDMLTRAGWDHSPQGTALKQEAGERLRASNAEMLDSRRQVFALEQQIKREQIEAGRASLAALHDRGSELRKILKEEENARKSAAARFGSLSESDQQRTLAAARKYKQGGALTRDDEDRFSALGGAPAEIADASRERRALATPGYRELIEEGIFRPKSAGPTAELAKINANITNTFNVTLTNAQDYEKLGRDFVAQVKAQTEQSNRDAKEYLDEAIRRENFERALRDGTKPQ